MMHEVRSIPAAPRRVRVGAILAHRWPMALLGAVLVGTGGLLSWMLFLAAGAKPSDERRLNENPTVRAEGTVTDVDPAPKHIAGKQWYWVSYDFDYRDRKIGGRSMASTDTWQKGMAAVVELLPGEPIVNRIVGTTLHIHRVWLAPEAWLGAMVVPGALLLLGWLAGVFHLRHVLIYGDSSGGKVTAAIPVRWVLPEMVAVTFEFRDHHAIVRRGRHWVRARSVLGARLIHQAHTGWFEPMPVLHDRRFPQWNRMVLAGDFLHGYRPGPDLESVG